jgi:hypothetical protein
VSALDDNEVATLGTAALRGWIAGVLTGVAGLALFMLWEVGPRDLLLALPAMISALLMLAVVGGLVALPSAGLFWAILLLAERVTLRMRTLPVWLTAGLVAAIPAAGIVWNIACVLNYDSDDLDGSDPFAWYNLQFAVLVLVCALVGAFFAWRYRQAELAELTQ